jgi:hypothetical protein
MKMAPEIHRSPPLLAALLLTLTGCSDSGDGVVSFSALSGGWVTITSPSDSGSATTYCSSVTLSGEAFISTDYAHCCSGSATDTGVSVSWENQASGTRGAASQSVDYCYLFGTPYLCNHSWYATVPLLLGDNLIQITAIDPGGSGGRDSLTVNQPEYAYDLSGVVSSDEGVGLGYFQSGMELVLEGRLSRRVVTASAAAPGVVVGQYRFSCIPDGNYTITPVAAFDLPFAPTTLAVSVAGGGLTALDFKAGAYPLSGAISDAEGGARSSYISVTIDGTGASVGRWSWPVAADGRYEFLVPNGSYTLTPHDLLCLTCSFTPPSRAIEVAGGGSSGLDFTWNP